MRQFLPTFVGRPSGRQCRRPEGRPTFALTVDRASTERDCRLVMEAQSINMRASGSELKSPSHLEAETGSDRYPTCFSSWAPAQQQVQPEPPVPRQEPKPPEQHQPSAPHPSPKSPWPRCTACGSCWCPWCRPPSCSDGSAGCPWRRRRRCSPREPSRGMRVEARS